VNFTDDIDDTDDFVVYDYSLLCDNVMNSVYCVVCTAK